MNIDNLAVDDLLQVAKVAEAAERFEDMRIFLHKLVVIKCEQNKPLILEERNLISVAYKNIAGNRRHSWRILTQTAFEDIEKEQLDEYKRIIEEELEKICTEVIDLLEMIIPVAKTIENAKEDFVFYLKMAGDYYRYLSEFKLAGECSDKAGKFYEEAIGNAKESLSETNPTRLGLALNYSVCCYEILGKKDLACQIAKEAFDSAIEKLDSLNDSSYKDSTLIMQLLRDNLTLWTSEKDESQNPLEDE